MYSFFKLIDFSLNESEMERLNFGMYVHWHTLIEVNDILCGDLKLNRNHFYYVIAINFCSMSYLAEYFFLWKFCKLKLMNEFLCLINLFDLMYGILTIWYDSKVFKLLVTCKAHYVVNFLSQNLFLNRVCSRINQRLVTYNDV